MTFGERIAHLRKESGLTQEQLAQKIGVSRQSIQKYESDRADPRLLLATCMADVLGVSLDYLAKGGDKIDKSTL
jgi:transcriptional regulator with XRE-family HTH domain